MTRFAELDAVTIDGYGTLLELDDPLGHLERELAKRGASATRDALERGFAAEVDYYLAHNRDAGDEGGLGRLYVGCARAFLHEVGLALDPEAFAGAFPFAFRPVAGAAAAVDALAGRGLALAVVANWDHGLHEQLRRHALAPRFATVVVSAEVGAAKPDPRPFEVALERMSVAASRTVHVGDHEDDERGAAAAGIAFVPAPLRTAFGAWT